MFLPFFSQLRLSPLSQSLRALAWKAIYNCSIHRTSSFPLPASFNALIDGQSMLLDNAPLFIFRKNNSARLIKIQSNFKRDRVRRTSWRGKVFTKEEHGGYETKLRNSSYPGRRNREGYIAPLRLSFIPAPLFRGNVDASLKGTYRHVAHTLGLHGAYKASCNSEPRHNGRLRGYGEHGRQDRQQPGAIIVYTDDDLYVRSYMGGRWGPAAHAHAVKGGCAVSLFFFPSSFLPRERLLPPS